ncbi:MAG: leucyl aminopeptidase [Myxococcales bacterium]|nr:leucyl aminopeptidase [Myxococcota bacterium]MDW8281700.1 leucyl aminopeptidase [Myxococcales bacterium]
MKFTFYSENIAQLRTDVCALPCFEDMLREGTAFQSLDQALDGLLGRLVSEEQFKGKKGQTLLLHSHGRVGPARILLVGGGPRREFQPSDLRGLSARAVRTAHGIYARHVTVVIPHLEGGMQERAAQFLAEGAILGGYVFDRYLTGERKRPLSVEEVCLAVSTDNIEPSRLEPIRHGVQRGEQVAKGVQLARDLVNEPASELTPRKLAEIAQRLAKEHHLEARIFGPRECEKMGMGMFLAVAQGSDEEPRFIHLSYRPRGKTTPRKRVALIGKGITFDSGGLSLKPSNAMEDMKIDMAGAAVVLSAITVLADLGCPYEVHAITACTENMPSGKAYKLGDVLRSMAGKTVEINNTDAEGRLTLGDAITYALKEVKPDEIFDFATLTGACMVALGPHIAGVMGNDLSLVERWLTAARLAGEEMWHLPLPERLKDMLKSEIADMKNTGERYGGALTAGLFLKEFVGDTPWVHVDMAGPAATDKEWGHICKGATGFGVATVVEYLAPRE